MKNKNKNTAGLLEFTELPDTSNPKTVLIYRKTKAGKWEKVQSNWYRQGCKTVYVPEICNWLASEEARNDDGAIKVFMPYKVAYKAMTVKGKQIYSTEYRHFIDLLLIPDCEGIMVNKTKFIPKDRIARWMKEISANHGGIKNWKKSAFCKEDNYLIWGYLICNDGHKEKVAIIGYNGGKGFDFYFPAR